MPFDTDALRYAVVTAEMLSFAKAAAHERIKQATLSRRVAQLEARLGLKLFERSTRGAVPTDAGLRFVAFARRILEDLDALHDTARAVGKGQIGTLAIGFSTSLAAGNLRSLIADFVERFPRLRLANIEGDRARLAQALSKRRVDFAVITGELPDTALQRRALWSERIMVMIHDSHPLAGKGRIYWPDLRGELFILPEQDPGRDLAAFVAARLCEPGWSPSVETHEVSRENVANFVNLGHYITLTTDASLGRILSGVAVREIYETSGSVSQLAYTGYWRSDNSNPALGNLLKLIADRFAP